MTGDMSVGVVGAVLDRERDGAEATELRKKRDVVAHAAAVLGIADRVFVMGCGGGGVR